jgi:hypothetical protein
VIPFIAWIIIGIVICVASAALKLGFSVMGYGSSQARVFGIQL